VTGANALIRGYAKSVVVRGSVMLAVPQAFLDPLHLRLGSTVGLAISEGCLVIDPSYLPALRPRYSLAELLTLSDYANSPTSDQREWVDAAAVGGELT
jgi:antitoxin ChpS